MGNALNSVGKALDAKLIGGNPLESKFAAIDKGITGVQDWKTNIDKQRLELKQNTAKQIREAEKYAFENMPNDETAKARILKDLAKYKDQMLMNERLVRNGAISPEENLIFFQNGKQTFEIYADMVNNFDKELELTEKRAKGYYVTDEKTGEQKFVKPESGELEAIKQRIQTQIGTLSGIETNFTEQGMGNITFYQMEVDPKTNTYVPKLDANGNPMKLEGTQPNMSVLALSHKANTRADRRYLTDEVEQFAQSQQLVYETMFDDGMMVGNVETNARNNPQLATLINNKAGAMTTNIEDVASYFTGENGFPGKLVSFTEWDNLTEDQKNETVTVTILDENMVQKPVTFKKYSKVAAANSNNAIVPEMSKEQIEAVEGHVRKSLVDGLQRKITKGTKRTEFDPMSSGRVGIERGENDSVDLFGKIVKNYGGTPEEVRQSTENLMIRSGYKFEDTSPKVVKDVRDNEIQISQTYTVDKGDGAGSSSFELTTFVENPEWSNLTKDEIEVQKGLKPGDEGYIEQYVPVSRREYEDKMYELFKKKGDILSANEARTKYSEKNRDYNVSDNTYTTDADRSISITKRGTIEVPAIPQVSINTKIGDDSAISYLKGTKGYKEITDNWSANPSDEEIKRLMASFQTTIEQLDAEQGGNQLANSGITLGWNGNNLKIKKNGVEIFNQSFGTKKSGQVSDRAEAFLSRLIKEALPAREASRKDYECRGGYIVKNGSKTREECPE